MVLEISEMSFRTGKKKIIFERAVSKRALSYESEAEQISLLAIKGSFSIKL